MGELLMSFRMALTVFQLKLWTPGMLIVLRPIRCEIKSRIFDRHNVTAWEVWIGHNLKWNNKPAFLFHGKSSILLSSFQILKLFFFYFRTFVLEKK